MSAQTPQTGRPIEELNDLLRNVQIQRDHYKALCEELKGALDHILWIKDYGIDGKNEKGEFVNWPADERNAMYEIAKAALKKAEKP